MGNWITTHLTAAQLVNHTAGSIAKTVNAVRKWAKLKHKKARYEAIDLVQAEAQKPASEQDWQSVTRQIQNLQF